MCFYQLHSNFSYSMYTSNICLAKDKTAGKHLYGLHTWLQQTCLKCQKQGARGNQLLKCTSTTVWKKKRNSDTCSQAKPRTCSSYDGNFDCLRSRPVYSQWTHKQTQCCCYVQKCFHINSRNIKGRFLLSQSEQPWPQCFLQNDAGPVEEVVATGETALISLPNIHLSHY